MENKTSVPKELVKLREKELANGVKSLYLDVYRNGKRNKEYLKLYLVDAKTRAEKEQNRKTLADAEALRSKRIIELQKGNYSMAKQYKDETFFLDYYRDMVEARRKGPEIGGNWGNWHSCLRYLEMYCDETTTFKDVTPEFIKGFREFLDTVEKDTFKKRGQRVERSTLQTLSPNSKASYFNKLRACINQAYEEGVIAVNPMRGIKGFKVTEVKREYLTLEELQLLAATECRFPALKRAFLFSCLTGLRKSDIEKLTWGEVQRFGDFTRIVFRQKKTGGQEYLDITPEAEKYLGERGNPNDTVFKGFIYGAWVTVELKRWCLDAGFIKDLTFHSGRHTFAVLLLDLGADIYTVSKLLGHKELHTTQIYAKVLDKNKRNAVSLIPKIG